MDTVHVYMSLHFASIESTVVNKTRFFSQPVPHSTFLPAHASPWPERSGATIQPLIALLSALLLRRMNREAT